MKPEFTHVKFYLSQESNQSTEMLVVEMFWYHFFPADINSDTKY